MKKSIKKLVCFVLVAAFVLSFAGCAKINYVTNGTIGAIKEVKSGAWQNAGNEAGADAAADTDDVKIDAFAEGTYGGVNFATQDDVVKYFVEAYDYTKTLTAEYIDGDGNKQTFYKLLGEEDLQVGSVMIDGSENSMINGLVGPIVDKLFARNTYGLTPCNNRNPEMDNNKEDNTKKAEHDFRTSALTPEDVLAANVKDNGDGTITITIQPKQAEMSTRGDDSQGRFFEVLGDIGSVVGQIDAISFSEGTADDNVKVTYKGGTGVFKIKADTKEIIEADYEMIANVAVNHANVAVIRNKSASLTITYKNHYPASDEYLKQYKQITRV